MKTVTKYQAEDGTEFKTESLCAAHEALCAEIETVMSALPPLPHDDGCDFANGHGYIQHDPEVFRAVRINLLLTAKRICPHKWIDDSIADAEVHSSWAGRIIGGSSRPLSAAWHRINCTDRQFREWGQPYYANYPDKAPEVKQINARKP